MGYDGLEREAFPGCPNHRVAEHRLWVAQAEERVKQPAVGDVDFRGLDLSFSHVLVPGLQLTHDEGGDQGLDVAANGMSRNAERLAERGSVPDLSVPVREHGPEAAQGRRWNSDAELRRIALQEGRDELTAPTRARGVGSREERPRRPPSIPEGAPGSCAHLVQTKSVQAVGSQATGERLRALLPHVWRRAPEDQEARGLVSAVGEHAKQGEQRGRPLDLVDDHQALQPAEGARPVGQPGLVDGILEIEGGHRTGPGRGDVPRQCGLADLASAEHRHYRKGAQQLPDLCDVACADDHGLAFTMKS